MGCFWYGGGVRTYILGGFVGGSYLQDTKVKCARRLKHGKSGGTGLESGSRKPDVVVRMFRCEARSRGWGELSESAEVVASIVRRTEGLLRGVPKVRQASPHDEKKMQRSQEQEHAAEGGSRRWSSVCAGGLSISPGGLELEGRGMTCTARDSS